MSEKTEKVKTYSRAAQIQPDLNNGKLGSLLELHSQWVKALPYYASLVKKSIIVDGKFPALYPDKGFITNSKAAYSSELNYNHHASIWAQVHGAYKSWMELTRKSFVKLVLNSTVDESLHQDLFFINKNGYWFSRTNVFEYTDSKTKETVTRVIPVETLILARRIIRALIERGHSFPRFTHCKAMMLNGRSIEVQLSKDSSFDYWALIPSLVTGKPIELPIRLDYLAKEKLEVSGSSIAKNSFQVLVEPELRLMVAINTPVSELRDYNDFLAMDWGLRSIFTTDKGENLGIKTWTWLQDRDKELLELTRALQKSGVKPRQSKRYRSLQHRITEYLKNEVNRILNRLSRRQISEIVVENLDFRGSSFSKRMSRILTRAGRRAVKAKLKDLEEKCGIKTTQVNPAFTSQQCPNCLLVNSKNRNDKHFKCLECGYKASADYVGSTNIRMRRSRTKLNLMKRDKIFDLLSREHIKRWHKGKSLCAHADNRDAYSRVAIKKVDLLESKPSATPGFNLEKAA
jgi:putative transposase